MNEKERYEAWQRYIEYLRSLERAAEMRQLGAYHVPSQEEMDKKAVEKFLESLGNTSGN